MAREALKDDEWIRQSFLLEPKAIDDEFDETRRLYTNAIHKFTDTTLGGNFVMNPQPQFTRFADLKVNNEYSTSKGMGARYSEIHDDHKQVVHFRLGTPKFNSLARFLGEFYSVEASSLARTGRAPGWFYEVGRATAAILSAPIMPVLFVGKVLNFMLNTPASRYYYLKPDMFPYWNALSSMVNAVATNLGVVPRRLTSDIAGPYYEGDEPDTDEPNRFHQLLPDIYREDGGIDVFALSTRAQRMANDFYEALDNEIARGRSKQEVFDAMRTWRPSSGDYRNVTLEQYRESFLSSPEGNFDESSYAKETAEEEFRDMSRFDKTLEFLRAERRYGAEFVSFRVENSSTQNESWSNSSRPTGIQETMNSLSQGARMMRINLADGNLDSTGVVKQVYDAASGFLNGVAEGFSIQGIAALAGSAYVDIPEVWDSSTADMNRTTLTIPLRCAYGNDMSRLMDLIIPLCALVAMSVPLSTGKQSYTSPFILEMFNRGRSQIQLGIVESLTVTRGVGDVGWTKDGKFLGADVTLTIKDLSTAMHMPLNMSFSMSNAIVAGVGAAAGAAVGGVLSSVGVDAEDAANTGAAVASALMPSSYDPDNVYTTYCATLGALSLEDQIVMTRKLRLVLTRQMGDFNQWMSPARMASWSMSGVTGDLIRMLSLETARR